jgi:branched-chain amino acid aminotransferase
MGDSSIDTLLSQKVWLDGKFIDGSAAQVHVLTHALHYGLAVFEGIRAYKTHDGRLAVFRLREHIQRLFDSAHIASMDMPFPEAEIVDACLELLRRQGKGAAEGAYIRPLAFTGTGGMGLGAKNQTRVAIAAWHWGTYLGDEGVKNGIRAKISSFSRLHPNVNMSRAKISGQYVNSILAKREALAAGYEEALLLDSQGYVAEATGENIFAVDREGIVRTPSGASAILKGITRDTVLRLLQDNGQPVREETFSRDNLYIAREVFLTGTAAEVTPIREIDDRKIAGGVVGPITRHVQEKFQQLTRGLLPPYADWLTYV